MSIDPNRNFSLIAKSEQESGNGILFTIEEDSSASKTEIRYIIRFDYSLEMMQKLNEGDFIAVPNYYQGENLQSWTILTIIYLQPKHFAMRNADLAGLPGPMISSLKNAAEDWYQVNVLDGSFLTGIFAEAISTDFIYTFENGELSNPIEDPSALPMQGTSARILKGEKIIEFINRKILLSRNRVLLGRLKDKENIPVDIAIDKLIPNHFGIFGTTGSGKSNLISTLISKVFQNPTSGSYSERYSNQSPNPRKVLIFDPKQDYTALLIDVLANPDVDANLVLFCTTPETTLSPLIWTYFVNDNPDDQTVQNAAAILSRSILIPEALQVDAENPINQNTYIPAIKELLNQNKIKLLVDDQFLDNPVMGQIDNLLRLLARESATAANLIRDTVPRYVDRARMIDNQILRGGDIGEISNQIEDFVENFRESIQSNVTSRYRNSAAWYTYESWNREEFQSLIDNPPQQPWYTQIPNSRIINYSQIKEDLNSEGDSLYIFQERNEPNFEINDNLRRAASRIANNIYRSRQTENPLSPIYISMIFDEADEFIPQSTQDNETKEMVKRSLNTVARRGRSFNIGMGIASQRITYLDTTVLAQLHTYFVWRLVRFSDRQRIAESAEIPVDQLRQITKFKKGEWLAVSDESLGLHNIPIPIKMENANERIKRWFLENYENNE